MDDNQLANLADMLQQFHGRLGRVEAHLAEPPPTTAMPAAAPPVAASVAFKPQQPDTFRGSRDSGKVRDWLFSLDLYFAACGVKADDQRIRLAALLFRDSALTWWRALAQQQPDTWEHFCSAVVDFFQPHESIELMRDRLHNLKQTGSAQAYADQFRAMALDIPDMSAAEQLDVFKRGLKDEVKIHMAYSSPHTFEEAVKRAVAIDVIQFHSRRAVTGSAGRNPKMQRSWATVAPSSGHQTTSSHGQHGAAPMEIGAVREGPALPPLTEAERARLRREGGCFRCRKPGHLAAKCPLNNNNQGNTGRR